MAKLIILVVGAALGFGGGVWYSAIHPAQAENLAATGQHDALEAQLKFAQTAEDQLNKAIANNNGVISKETLTNLRDEQQAKVATLQTELNAQGGQ